MKRHLAILLWATEPARPHMCSAPFFHAAAAAAMDVEVELFFSAESVRLLVRGVAESLHSGPRQRESVYAFMRQAAAHGARFYACPQALDERGLTGADLIPEVVGSAGAAAYIARCMDEDWQTLVY